MAKKKVQIKASTKVTDNGRKPPVKVKTSSGKGGFLTEKIALTVKTKK